jgi:outer membrane protein OmpA-like peptidoglycan-associated protein
MRTVALIGFILIQIQFLFAQEKPVKEKLERLKSPDMTVLGSDNKYGNNQGDTNEIIPYQNFSRFSAGVHFGVAYYIGEVPMDAAYPAYGFSAKYAVTHFTGLKFQYMQGSVSGTSTSNNIVDPYSYFKSDIASYSLQSVFNIGNVNFLKSKPRFRVNFGIGAGLFSHQSINDYCASIGINDTINKSNSGTSFFIPVQVGVKRKLSENLDFGLDLSYNIGTNDFLDMNNSTPLNDVHGYVTAGVTYNFVSKKKPTHLEWANPVEKIYKDLMQAKLDAEASLKNDGDQDGVPDAIDIEKNTKLGYKVDSKGKTLDSDDDGIPDTKDSDPYGFSKSLALYFPDMKVGNENANILQFSDSIPRTEFVTISESNYGLPTSVFPPNGFTVHVEQYGLLQQIARIMIVDTSASLLIIGHSDNNKPDLTQLTLSEKRALEVKRKLYRIFEIDDRRMLVFAEKDPYVKKYRLSTEGLNRKVEFRIIRPKK